LIGDDEESRMAGRVIEVEELTYRYGRVAALCEVGLAVDEGTVYGLLGPNGAGKTTLLQILAGLRPPTRGRVSVLGKPIERLSSRDRARIGYVAEGGRLPDWMRIEELERFLAPLYPTWDRAFAASLRERLSLEPGRRIGVLSRGERMKVALLAALAHRPDLVLLDEPFAGMDELVKDEIVRGLLASSAREGWTVVICSHDLGELETLVDRVGFLRGGRILLSDPINRVRARYHKVELLLRRGPTLRPDALPLAWMFDGSEGRRVSFIATDQARGTLDAEIAEAFPDAERVEVRPATLREVYELGPQEGEEAPQQAEATEGASSSEAADSEAEAHDEPPEEDSAEADEPEAEKK